MAMLRKISGRYYAYFNDSRRTPRQKSYALGTGMKDVAKRKLARLVVRYHDGEFDPWRPNDLCRNMTFVDAASAFMVSRASLRPKTLRAYRFMLEGLTQHLPPAIGVNDVTAKHVLPYVSDRSVSDATRRHRLRHTRVFFRWAVATGYADEDATKGVKLDRGGDKLPGFFTPEEFASLLKAIETGNPERTRRGGPKVEPSPWLRDVVVFAATTGLRQGEILALRWDGIDLMQDCETLTIRNDKAFKTKSGRDVSLPLVGAALDVVRSRRQTGYDASPYVFPGQKGGKMNPHDLSRRFKVYVNLAGLPDRLHFHSLRHTFGTQLAREGVPVLTISKLMGHSNTGVTQVYLHLGSNELRRAMKSGLMEAEDRKSKPESRLKRRTRLPKPASGGI